MAERSNNVISALVAVQDDLSHVGKSGKHQQGYSYRQIDDLMDAVHPLFAKHGIVIAPRVRNHVTVPLDTGKKGWTSTVLHVRYVVYGPGGVDDFIKVDSVGEAYSNSDKGVGAALSYAYKSVISQLLSLPTHEPTSDNEAQLTPAEQTDDRPDWQRYGWDTAEEADEGRAAVVDRLAELRDNDPDRLEELKKHLVATFAMSPDGHLAKLLTREQYDKLNKWTDESESHF